VAILRPLVQFAVDLAIYAGEGALGDTRAIVQRPAADDGIEGRDEGGLGRAPVVADGGLEAVQRDVGEQGGDDASLWRARFREQEFALVQDACCEPIAHQASERPDGVEFLEQGLVGDTVEAFLDVGVQGVLGLEADEVEACPEPAEGMASIASWAERPGRKP